MSRKKLLMIFVDGLGWGTGDPSRNPLAAIGSQIFPTDRPEEIRRTVFQGTVRAIDATLDTPGLPQSATGQTSLLTGINAASLLGQHLCGYPNARLKSLLAQTSVFIPLRQAGISCAFANAYQPKFFSHTPRHVSVTTAACQSAGLPLKTIEDLRRGQAVYQDFTHRYLREKGIDIDLLLPEKAGANLAKVANRYDFTLYEHFLTDRVGHSGDFLMAMKIAEELERFLFGLLQTIDLRTQSVLLVSDHGNLEEMSHSRHTRNPVYCITWGPDNESFGDNLVSITSLLPTIVNYFKNDRRPADSDKRTSRSDGQFLFHHQENYMGKDRLQAQLDFLLEIDRLKSVERRTYLIDGSRRENSAEHSWHVTVMALLLAEHSNQEVNLWQVLRLLLIHDIVEADAGDTYCYDEEGNRYKEEKEKKAADRLFGMLPEDQGKAFRQLWEEYEARQTPESLFANACDRLMPMMHNYYSGGLSWKEHDIGRQQVFNRNHCIGEGSNRMWEVAEKLMEQGVAKGWLRPGSAGGENKE